MFIQILEGAKDSGLCHKTLSSCGWGLGMRLVMELPRIASIDCVTVNWKEFPITEHLEIFMS